MIADADIDQSVLEFGQRLKDLRTQKKLSQADLGEKIGVTPTHIGRYERGESMPTAKALWLLAQALDVSIDYLVKGDQDSVVTTSFQNSAFMQMFKDAEKLSEEEKELIQKFLGYFLKNKAAASVLNS